MELIRTAPEAYRSSRRGFTLAEMVVALAAVSLLLGGLASIVMLTTRTLPDEDDPLAGQVAASGVLREIASDLMIATRVLEANSRAVTVIVPDRTGDGDAEQIRYAWSGTAGDPLTRSLNGGGARTVLAQCREFSFTLNTTASTEAYPGPLIQSGKVALSEYPAATSPANFDVSPTARVAQYTRPALPSDTVDWTPEAVRFRCASSGLPIEVLRVELQTPDPTRGQQPSGTVLDSASLAELNMSTTLRWEQLALENVDALPPSQGLCIVFETPGLLSAAKVSYETKAVAISDNALITGDPAWKTSDPTHVMEYQLLGSYRTQSSPKHITRTNALGADLTLAGVGSDGTAQLAAVFGNRPEQVSAVWEMLDYSVRGDDGNGDGEPDWTDVLDGLTLAGRSWPDCDFDRTTTIEMLALVDTLALTPATLEACLDWDGADNCVRMRARLERVSGSAQRLTFDLNQAGAWVTKATVSDLAAAPIDVRLVVAPDSNHVNLMVAGRRIGTYTYSVSSVAGARRAVWCNGGDLGVDIQRLVVRVAP